MPEGAGSPGARPYLVPVRREGPAAPLFMVHSMAGELTWLPALGDGLGDRPLSGFAAPGGVHPGRGFGRIEAMAAAYLDEVFAAAPPGPWLVGGYSFGGLVAFEMAREAAARGRPAAGLILLDAHAPTSPPVRALPRWGANGTLLQAAANLVARQWGGTDPIAAGELLALPEPGRLAAAAARVLGASRAPYPPATLEGHLARSVSLMRRHAAMMAAYRLGAFDAAPPALYVRAARGFLGPENPLRLPRVLCRDPDSARPWREALGGPVREVEVDASHFFLCEPPARAAVISAVRDFLGAGTPAAAPGPGSRSTAPAGAGTIGAPDHPAKIGETEP